MEVKINKEIRSYSEKIFFGLTLRQLVFSLLAIATTVTLYFITKKYFGKETISWICIVGAIPFAGLGFFNYNGMPLEKFIIAFIISELLTPKELYCENNNIYYKALLPFFNKKESEVLKK